MKSILIIIFISASLFANEAKDNDLLGGDGSKTAELRNGDQSGVTSNALTKVSLWLDINKSNIQQFKLAKNGATTLIKKNPYDKILLDNIDYLGIHPSYAAITATQLVLVFDTNNTKHTGELVIKTGTLRDGDQGGALNTGNIKAVTGKIIDKASPVIFSYETVDDDTDGHIDQIKLTFSETITEGTGDINKSLTIGSSYIKKTGASATGKILTILLTEKTAFDTGVAPTVSYSHTYKTDSNISDSAGNIVPTFSLTSTSTVKTRDTVKPLLKYVQGESIHAANDKIHLGFSEPITKILKGGRVVVYVDGGTTASKLTNATFGGYHNGDKNMTITLNEAIDGAILTATIKPKITIETNVTDLHDNNFTRVIKREAASAVIKETTPPKVISLRRNEDKDELILTFDEAMDKGSVETSTNYVIASKNLPVGTTAPTISGRKQASDDKKSVILSIDDFPSFAFKGNTGRTITIQAKAGIKDYVGNTLAEDTNKSYVIAKDGTDPMAENFELNMITGKLKINFNESVAVGQFAPTTIDINISYTKKETLSSESTATYANKVVTISLNDDLDRIKDLIRKRTDVNLTIRSGSQIFDFASNEFKGGNVSLASIGTPFTADNVPPKLQSWDYDLDNKTLTLLFDEDMNVSSSYDATKITLGDSNTSATNDLQFLEKKSSSKATSTYRKVEIYLLASQINAILTAKSSGNLDINESQTFIKFASGSGIMDSAGNEIAAATMPPATQSTWESKYNAVANLKVIPNKWNHISVDHNTTSNNLLSTGKVSYIYGHDGTNFVEFPATLSSHKGYWIKTSNFSGTSFNVAAIKNVKGSKEDDLNRIRNSEAKLNLIGIENSLTYEEIRAKPDTKCKYKRIHHYVSDTTASKEGWDANKSVSANDALWVLCIK